MNNTIGAIGTIDDAIICVMRECTELSLAGTITFPEVVGKLAACGVESYHVDLNRSEKTCYLSSGDSHVETMEMERHCIAADFSAEKVQEAIRESQQGRITYREFLRRVTDAGSMRYFVYIRGRCAVYIGRDGSQHVERFPVAD